MTKKVKHPSNALRQSPKTTESQALKFTWVGVALLVVLLGGVALLYIICGKAKQEQLQKPSARLGTCHFASSAPRYSLNELTKFKYLLCDTSWRESARIRKVVDNSQHPPRLRAPPAK